MRANVTEEFEGKRVVHDGETIGRVVDVEHDIAYVDPDPGITDKLFSMLGWADHGGDAYPLQEEAIERVTDDEIRLKSRL